MSGILLLVLVSGIVFWKSKGEIPQLVQANRDASNSAAKINTTATSSPSKPRSSLVPGDLPPEIGVEIEKCLGKQQKTPENMEDFFHLLEKEAGKPTSESIEWKNIHGARGSQHFRLRLVKENNEAGKEIVRFRYFKVDKEGLPDPIDIPKKHEINPTDKILSTYLKDMNIELTQEAKTISYRMKEKKTYDNFLSRYSGNSSYS